MDEARPIIVPAAALDNMRSAFPSIWFEASPPLPTGSDVTSIQMRCADYSCGEMLRHAYPKKQ